MNILRYIITQNVKKQAKLLALVLGCAVFGLIPIQLFRMILDRAIPTHNSALLLQVGAALLITSLIGAIINFYRAVVSEQVMLLFVGGLRGELIHHLLRVSPEFHVKTSLGQLTNRLIQDVSRLGISMIWIFIEPLVHLVTFVVFLVYLLSLDATLTVLALVPLVVIVPLIPKINERMSKAAQRLTSNAGAYSGLLSETFSSIAEVQNHGTFAYEERRLRAQQELVASYQIDEQRQKAKLTLLSDFMRGVGPLAVYLYGATLAIAGELRPGSLVAFVSALGGLYVALDKILKYPPLLRFAQERFIELRELLRNPIFFTTSESTKEEAPRAGGVDVSLTNVSFGYTPQSPVAKEVTLKISAGQHVALVGRSGCGKSTVLGLISGKLQPSEGEVQLGGSPLKGISTRQRTGSVGFAAQLPLLFNTTLRNNLAYSLLRGDAGDPKDPLSFLRATDADSAAFERRLLSVCRDVGFEEDLFELALKTRIRADQASEMLTLRAEAGAALSREEIERFDPAQYQSRASVAENLIFAPLLGALSSDDVRSWVSALTSSRPALPGLLAELGWSTITQDLEFLARVSERNPTLLTQMGVTQEEVKERLALSARVQDRARTEEALGAELFASLVERGLRSREPDDAMRAAIVLARASFAVALGSSAPPQYDPARWHDSLSLRENLLFGIIDPSNNSANQRIQAKLREVITRAGALEKVLAWGLSFEVGEKGARLSGGQRQKIAIARVLLKEPQLLLLDEITASLDEVSAQHVQRTIAERYRERTVIAVTHRLQNLGDFQRVIVFDKGRIVEDGPPAELLAKHGALYRLREGV